MDASSNSSFEARWSLRGHTALVTCGARGIGKAIVEELASFGASVFTCARVGPHLEECLSAWREAGFDVEGVVCESSSRPSRIQLMQEVAHHFGGKLDILVNNVGIIDVKPAVEVTEEDFSSTMASNLESAYHFAQLAHPLLRASIRGRIVFVSSVLAFTVPAFPCSVYSMCKGATNQLTKVLAAEWVHDRIRVNAVAPGVVETENSSQAFVDRRQKNLKDIPMERPGNPKEAAAAVTFFCLPCSSFCTGQVLVVDGGTTIRPAFGPSKTSSSPVHRVGRTSL